MVALRRIHDRRLCLPIRGQIYLRKCSYVSDCYLYALKVDDAFMILSLTLTSPDAPSDPVDMSRICFRPLNRLNSESASCSVHTLTTSAEMPQAAHDIRQLLTVTSLARALNARTRTVEGSKPVSSILICTACVSTIVLCAA